MDSYSELLECGNGPIVDMSMKCEAVLSTHDAALVSVSGGADSDVMVDLCERVRPRVDARIDYVWYDTGMEYKATKDHIRYIEDRYGIEVMRVRASKTIPACVREYGQPFVSKMVSRHLGTLQRHGFRWDDLPLPILQLRYPRCPESTLKWWTNKYQTMTGAMSSYCIGRNRLLKEFVMENPPWFPISAKCCDKAKKETKRHVLKGGGWDVELVGVRRSEGGVRALHGKCFLSNATLGVVDQYRPLFWLSDSDRMAYDSMFSIRHSDCYERWGFKRTGCVGCPFNMQVFDDLEKVHEFEPNMCKAAHNVFADAYEYAHMFAEFKAAHGMRR